MSRRRIAGLIVVSLALACGSDAALDRGRSDFNDPGFSPLAGNAFSCATCHATTATANPARLDSGYTLYDAASRPSWWGGAYTTLHDAADECYTQFMGGPPLAVDDPEGRALYVYLASLAPDATAPALPMTVEKDIVTEPGIPGYIADGDATRGATRYTRACGSCHGALSTGAGHLGGGEPRLPDDSVAAHGCGLVAGWRPITVEKVRHGGFFGVGGRMPLYSVEALSDGDLGDVLAYLKATACAIDQACCL